MRFNLQQAVVVVAVSGSILGAFSRAVKESEASSHGLQRRIDIDPDPVPDPDVPMPDAPDDPGTPDAPATPGDPAPGAPAPAPGGDGSTLTVAQLQARGDTATTDLDNAISHNTADTTPGDISQVYSVSTASKGRPDADIKQILTSNGKNGGARTYTQYSIMNKAPNSKTFTILKVSGPEGVIINEMSFGKTLDTLTTGKVKLSDQQFEAWQKEGGSTGLSMVVQHNIINKATENAIDQAHTAAGLVNKPGNWLPGSDAYRALIGSDNGRPTVFMLQDHHQALGNKKVTSITTYQKGPAYPSYFMLLNIG